MNLRNVWRFGWFLALLVCAVNTSAQARPDSDTQQWTEVQVAVPITKEIDFVFLGSLRLGRDVTHPVDERLGAGVSFRIGKYLTVSPHYLNIGTRPVEGRKGWENRLSLPVLFRFNLGKFRISDRNMFERRLRSTGVKSTRYRNRLQVEHPIGNDKWNLSGYMSEEVFYDWSVDRWVRNRFAIGVTKVFNKHFTQDLYYMRQNDSVSVPGDLHVIGTSLRFRL